MVAIPLGILYTCIKNGIVSYKSFIQFCLTRLPCATVVCETEIEKAKHTTVSSGFGDMAPGGSTTAKVPLAKQKKTKGASLVNPSSKRYIKNYNWEGAIY